MVFCFVEGSRVNFAFRKSWPPTVTVVSPSLQTRFQSESMVSGTTWPSADPETIVHSPCNWAISFLLAGLSSARQGENARAVSPRTNAIRNVFIVLELLGLGKAKPDIKRV